ncbi:MAG: hypothetical protein RJA98_1071 [Pseudomonadota bacterium]|jgi:hypothetical protein
MFGMNKNPQPVDIVITEHTLINGEAVLKGQVIEQVAPELALDLAANGKARGIKDDDDLKACKAAWRAANKAAAPAAAASSEAQQPAA